ncbi:MAG: RNA-binding protein [Sandaracinus sp.]|nr:RNA-binding protein [Sandaracinus sp.]MCB9636001.1 RNA-binding protein [Sandaracinus sp.]
MTTKVFVGGLSWGTNDDQLFRAFEKFGSVVEARVITDRDTGRSRGFGFVTFDDATAAQSAIEGMDGKTLDGRAIRVNEATERAPRAGGPGGGGRGGFGGGGGGGRGGFGGDRGGFGGGGGERRGGGYGDREGGRGGRGGFGDDRRGGGRGGDRW